MTQRETLARSLARHLRARCTELQGLPTQRMPTRRPKRSQTLAQDLSERLRARAAELAGSP
jgi:hypothetical protein